MSRLRSVALLLVLALLAAGVWRWLPSQPYWGYALMEAYCLVSDTPCTITGAGGAALAALILSRPLMWLFLGYAFAVAVGCGRRALLVSLLVLVGLAVVCVVARQTAGLFLLGFTDISLRGGAALSLLGGIAFALPGALCAAVRLGTGQTLASR